MLLSSSNRKYPPFPLLYFSVVVCLRSCHIIFGYLLHKNSGKTGNYFSLFLCSFWWVQIIGHVLAWGSYSFICRLHHLSLSSLCKLMFVECVSKIKLILSVIHYTICGAVCFQFTNFPCDDWENIYTLSYYHHQIGSMNYNPLFRVRSWNNGVRCMSFYILTIIQTLRHHVRKINNSKFWILVIIIFVVITDMPILLTWIAFNPSFDKLLHLSIFIAKIVYPFPNVNSAAVDVWEWINNFIAQFISPVIIYSCWN